MTAEDTRLTAALAGTPTRRFARTPQRDTGGARVLRLPRLGVGISEGTAPAVVARDSIQRALLVCADVLAAMVALVAAIVVLGDDRLTAASAALVPLAVIASRMLRLHERDELVLAKTTLDEGPALLHLATFFALVTYIGQPLFVDRAIGPLQGLGLWGGFLACSLLARALIRRAAMYYAGVERCLVIGDDATVADIEDKLDQGGNTRAQVVAAIAPSELPEHAAGRALLAQVVEDHCVHRVVVAFSDLENERLLELVRDAKALGVKVSIKPRILDVVGSAVVFDEVHGSVFLGVRRFGLTAGQRRVKRAIDIAGSLALLLLLAPVLGLFALLIKLDSRGPVIFHQVRVGRDGRRFRIFKFRTMVADAEQRKAKLLALNEAGEGLFKLTDDPRVTRVGRYLRRTALDELPQLVNVLRGEMSLVGPRPLVVEEDERLNGWHRRRLHLVPGMTGVWQVLGSARIPVREMVALDYLYIVNWSVWNDLQILLRTVPFVLSRKGI